MTDSNFFKYPFTYKYKDEAGEEKLQVVPGVTFVDEIAMDILSRKDCFSLWREAVGKGANSPESQKYSDKVTQAYSYAWSVADIRRQVFVEIAKRIKEAEDKAAQDQGKVTVDAQAEVLSSNANAASTAVEDTK